MKSEDTNVGVLEEEARKRRERLEQLKNKRSHENTNTEFNSNSTEKKVLPKPKFRSYNPIDESLKEKSLPKAKPESVSAQIEDDLSSAKPEQLIDEVDLTSLAPRKVDWDLKRNVGKKLEKLEKRTQRAIAELIRERLKEGVNDNLVKATEDMESATKAENSDDD